MTNEILDFLRPDFGDPIQKIAFSVIILMSILTVIGVSVIARPSSWEKKWHQGTPNDNSDDLDIEHGSVTDLWHAVATAPEKLADIIPGMLLIIGLLGTFLGLGLALNHASNILGQPDAMSASGAASSMHDLLGMLKGLGTKFKTSTWGILGFIALKIVLELIRYDERRLTWVIQRVKEQINQRKAQCIENEEGKQKLLFEQMQGITNGIVDGFTKNVVVILEQNKKQHESCESQLSLINSKLVEINISNGNIGLSINDAINVQTQALDKSLQEIIERNENQHISNEKELREFNTHMIDLKGTNRDISASMKNTIDAQSEVLNRSLQEINNNIEAHKNALQLELQTQTSTLGEHLLNIQTSTENTMGAMKKFTAGTETIVKNMADAASQMASGADLIGEASGQIGGAAENLVGAVDLFKTQFTDVLDNVRHDLGSAITNMSAQASETLERGSQQLGDATKEISVALAQLSDDVKGTMDAVQHSISRALEIQQKSQAAFTISTNTLTEKIDASTGVVEAMATPIKDGLKAISTSNRRLTSAAEAIDESNHHLRNVTDALIDLPNTFKPLAHLADVPEHIQAIKSLLNNMVKNQIELTASVTPLKLLDDMLPHFNVILASLNDLRSDLEPLQLLANHTEKTALNMQVLTALAVNTDSMLNELKTLRSDISVAVRHKAIPEMAN